RELLKLFWFSQTVGPNRGLETIISAIAKTNKRFEPHLLGKIDQVYKLTLLSVFNQLKLEPQILHFHLPIPPDDIFASAANFDIGFASEPGFSKNNSIALSNKLFTYIQCGLVVAVSNTQAQ